MDARVEVVRRLARRGAHGALRRALTKSRAVDIAAAISHLAPGEQRLSQRGRPRAMVEECVE